ncbi:MAG: glycosyltransferase, partial [Paludibacter sp.]
TKRFGIITAIEALVILKKRIPGVTLQVYGKYDDSYYFELCESIDRNCLKDSVYLGGYKSLEEVSRIIDSADIGIVPYLSDPFMNLALSTKTFEYVAKGLPVIASRLSSIQEIFDQSISYFNPGDCNDLSEKIFDYCYNPGLREDNVNKSFSSYKHISWPIMSERYYNLISKSMV